jgi:hypothetical protein
MILISSPTWFLIKRPYRVGLPMMSPPTVVGRALGLAVGDWVGIAVGEGVGRGVGAAVGRAVGAIVGIAVGLDDGAGEPGEQGQGQGPLVTTVVTAVMTTVRDKVYLHVCCIYYHDDGGPRTVERELIRRMAHIAWGREWAFASA